MKAARAIRRPPPAPAPVLVPPRVGLALRPELDRRDIPPRVNLQTNAPPFAGELREDQYGEVQGVFASNARMILATLRRPWLYVGFAIDPGDLTPGDTGLKAWLRVLTSGVNGALPPVTVSLAVPTIGPQAFEALRVAARAELVLFNGSEGDLHGVRATIWGMGEM